jgi:L-threonylcarbamoyladenylate synthase
MLLCSMETRIVTASEIGIAADLLKQGEPVVFPTETVYGLGAPVFDEKAVSKIFAIKNRPSDNPLIVHIGALDDVSALAQEPPPSFWKLAERFCPGPIAFVLEKQAGVPTGVSAGHPTVAIRMPSHPVALELIRAVGEPLAAPSANLSGRPSPTRAKDAWEDLQGRVALILDGGDCQIGIESTVLSLIGSEPLLLRPGSITKEEIEDVLQAPVLLPSTNSPVHSPGMKYRHYAPKAEVRLVFERENLSGPFILAPHPRKGERLLSEKTLYAEFREADRLGFPLVEIDCSSPSILRNIALLNRLVKAADFEEILYHLS